MSCHKVAVLTKGVWDTPNLAAFLPFNVEYHPLIAYMAGAAISLHYFDAVLGWGRKPSAIKAQRYAQQQQLPFISLEDGFLRSVGLGSEGCPPVAMIIDHQGIYFDAHRESELEQLIVATQQADHQVTQYISTIITHQLSKYNLVSESFVLSQADQHKINVLIVDQTYGDQSIEYSGAKKTDFERMLWQACHDYPDANIWIKTHPEVAEGIKKGCLSHIKENQRVRKITAHANPIALLQQMDVVYVVSSHMGFEALMLQKRVYCFGMPWYAGWGLTDDRYAPRYIASSRRGVAKSVDILFDAAYLQYTRYVNPSTQRACDMQEALDWLIENKRWSTQLAGQVVFYRFSHWKEHYLRRYFKLPFNQLSFEQKIPAQSVDHLIYWGALNKQNHPAPQALQTHVMEDGFIRSIGLGAKLIRPLSLVIDHVGIYYDATQPSGLEQWYNTAQLSDAQRQRAQQVRERLVSEGLSKYNVGEPEDWPDVPPHQRCILISGQVEDDASVLLGGVDVRTNLQLIQLVRAKNPDAFLVYKPHPDVTAGLRVGAVDPVQLDQYVDAVVQRLGMPACLSRVDEVHTITSLTGFEALLRGVSVSCYGLPFYAGWGLTTDLHHCSRRSAQLSLDELVYGALIAYPLYMLPEGEGFVQVEQAIDELIKQRQYQQSIPQKALGYSAKLRATTLKWSKRLWP